MPSNVKVNVSVEKCVEIKGDYVEKQQSCFISVTLKSWSGQKLLDPTTYQPLFLVGGEGVGSTIILGR